MLICTELWIQYGLQFIVWKLCGHTYWRIMAFGELYVGNLTITEWYLPCTVISWILSLFWVRPVLNIALLQCWARIIAFSKNGHTKEINKPNKLEFHKWESLQKLTKWWTLHVPWDATVEHHGRVCHATKQCLSNTKSLLNIVLLLKLLHFDNCLAQALLAVIFVRKQRHQQVNHS